MTIDAAKFLALLKASGGVVKGEASCSESLLTGCFSLIHTHVDHVDWQDVAVTPLLALKRVVLSLVES